MNNYIENCKVLGLNEVTTESQLKTAYYHTIRQCHPDKFCADRNQYDRAVEKTKRVNLAYSYLADLVKKKAIPQLNKKIKVSWAETAKSGNYKPGLPDDTVLEIPLRSNHTVSVGYDYETYIMFIKFANSKVYKFFDISPKIFEEFLTAKSHHKYAHNHIFFRFPYVACKM